MEAGFNPASVVLVRDLEFYSRRRYLIEEGKMVVLVAMVLWNLVKRYEMVPEYAVVRIRK